MRRGFRRRRGFSRRARADTIWGPFVFVCEGTVPSLTCSGSPTLYPFLTNADWQPDASSDVSYDHATLLRTILNFTWNIDAENTFDAAFIWGIARLDRNVVGTDLGTLWAPGPWGAYDVLWGPHVQSAQSFAQNPMTVDLKTKRRLSSNDRLVLLVQGNSLTNNLKFWCSGRYLINRE